MAYSYGNHEVYRYWSNGLKCDRVKRISKKEIYMKTEIVKIDEEQIDQEAIARAGEILKRGGLVAFPTETVYGLGGDALNENSSRLIYAAKGRPSDNPLIVHITNMEALKKIVTEIPPAARKLAERYWPGPLTMIFHKSSAVPLATTGGLDTVAVRMPSHKTARAMIDAAGGYIAAPSANRSGRPSPTVARYVIEDLDGLVDMIIDGGEVNIGLESTIIDLTGEVPTILRPGYVTQDMLTETLGLVDVDRTILDANSRQAPKAPGMKYRHYAPKANLTIVSGEAGAVIERINALTQEHQQKGEKVGIICTDESRSQYVGDVIKSTGSRQDEDSIAQHLYAILRDFDDMDVDVIFSESFATPRIGHAIMNRLLKAAGHQVIEV